MVLSLTNLHQMTRVLTEAHSKDVSQEDLGAFSHKGGAWAAPARPFYAVALLWKMSHPNGSQTLSACLSHASQPVFGPVDVTGLQKQTKAAYRLFSGRPFLRRHHKMSGPPLLVSF